MYAYNAPCAYRYRYPFIYGILFYSGTWSVWSCVYFILIDNPSNGDDVM